jgi:transcriptional regulator with XRE-family HTH domain
MTNHATRQIATTVADNIRAGRHERGLTQREMAALLDTDAMSVSRWERGATTPSVPNLVRIAEALGVSVDSLYLDRDAA